MDVGAVGDHRQRRRRPPQRRCADRRRRGWLGGQNLLHTRIAIERDVLVVEHRIRIGHRRRHQPARVLGRRRHDNLQSRRPIEPRLGVLAVVRTGIAQPAPRHPHHHRHLAAPPVADLGGVVDQLVETGGHEIVELHLADRPLAGQRRADTHAEHRAFGQRRVEDAIAELLEQRPQQQERVAVGAADVLAVDEDARIGAQGVADAEHHRLEKRVALLVERQAGFERRQRRRRHPVARRAGSSTSTRTRGASSLNTPIPASSGSGHGSATTRCACASTRSSAHRCSRPSSEPLMTFSASSRAA